MFEFNTCSLKHQNLECRKRPEIAWVKAHLASLILSFFGLMLSLASPSAATADTTVSLIQIVGAKAILGNCADAPKDSSGVLWSSPGYNDSRWGVGLTAENNSVPQQRAKFWRAYVQAQPFPTGTRASIFIEADDSIDIFVDGFPIGNWGNAAKGVVAGKHTVDVTKQLTPGQHLICIKVCNGPGFSKMEFRIQAVEPGSPGDILSAEWSDKYRDIKTQEQFHSAITEIDKAIAMEPQNNKLYEHKMKVHTLYQFPRHFSAINSIGLIAKKVGCQASPYFWARANLQLGDLNNALVQQKEYEKVDGADNLATVEFYSEFLTAKVGTPELRKEAEALVRLCKYRRESDLWLQVAAAESLLKSGLPELASPMILSINQHGTKSQHFWLRYASSIEVLQGDYSKARDHISDAIKSDIPTADFELSKVLLLTGDWLLAEPLLQKSVKEISTDRFYIRRNWDYPLKAALVRVLAIQGKIAEARTTAKLAPPLPTEDTGSRWYMENILWSRLQIAQALDDEVEIRQATEVLYTKLAQRRKIMSGQNDLEPELLSDLMRGLLRSGYRDSAMALATDSLNRIPDTTIPGHKAARAQALICLNRLGDAKLALAEAAMLAPEDFWIRRALENLSTP